MNKYFIFIFCIIFYSSCKSTHELQNQSPLGTYYSSAYGSPGEIQIRGDSTAVIVVTGHEYIAAGEGIWRQIDRNTIVVKLDTVDSILKLICSGEFFNRRPIIHIKGFNSVEFENRIFLRSAAPPTSYLHEEISNQIEIRDHIHEEMAKNEK
jgi:hypothetical protein